MSAALAPALPAPVSTAPGIHAIGPVLPGTPRAMKRAHARQMPSCVLRAVIKDNRHDLCIGVAWHYDPVTLAARIALESARCRAALAARGEPVRAANRYYDEPEPAP